MRFAGPSSLWYNWVMRVKPIVFFVIVASVIVFLMLRDNTGGPIRIGQIAPDFSVKDSTGKLVHFADFRGKFVLVNFWYSDCAPCEQEMPDLQTITNTFKNRKFEILPISVDVKQDDIKEFYVKHNLTMPWYWDPGRQVYSKFHATGYPETFLIDHNGHILKKYVGQISVQIIPTIESYIREQETAEQASAR